MNITFLIGNGFDRNLGLKTTYADFIAYYKTTKGNSDNLNKFRKHIDDNEELWQNAEVALGKYTEDFETGNGMAFSACHQDMCEHLSKYLMEQESQLSIPIWEEQVLSSLKNIVTPEIPFPTQERNEIRGVFNAYSNEPYTFNFLTFNYTSTLDTCVDLARNATNLLGAHKYGNTIFTHSIGKLFHVHGTVNREMVFAVNDETQIAKPEIFDFENGDICKRLLIKQQANDSYQENTDSTATGIIQTSTIIYIYGMSLGETDKVWWQRICQWLNANAHHHLIIHNFNMPTKGVYPLSYQLEERKKKLELLSYSNFNEPTKTSLLKRIHITGENIFSDISDIETKKPMFSKVERISEKKVETKIEVS